MSFNFLSRKWPKETAVNSAKSPLPAPSQEARVSRTPPAQRENSSFSRSRLSEAAINSAKSPSTASSQGARIPPTPPAQREDSQSLPRCDEWTCALLQYYRDHLYRSAGPISDLLWPPASSPKALRDSIPVSNPLWTPPSSTDSPELSLHGSLAPWQTRLVKLVGFDHHPGLLEVEVFPVEFTDMDGVGVTGTTDVVTYVALSHVWGTNPSQTIIFGNGRSISVPSTIKEALCYLFQHTSERYIWVDKLCINQADATEKASQVRNMLRIFEKASKVIAWVGTRATLSASSIFDLDPCRGQTHGRQCRQAWRALRSSLSKIAGDELWSRTWCRQEIFAAKTLLLLGPGFTMTNLRLDRFYGMLRQCMQDDSWIDVSEDRPKDRRIPTNLAVMFEHYQHAGTDDYSYVAPAIRTRYTAHWLRLLNDGTAFKVTDERDRVYAIFGMVCSASNRLHVEYRPDIQPGTFPIDYSKTVSEVYQDLVKYLINTDQNLDCLTVLEDRRTRDLPDDLPSWVIDWRHHQPRSLLAIPPSRSVDQEAYGVPRKQDMNEPGCLVLAGQVLFEIKELSAYKRTFLEQGTTFRKEFFESESGGRKEVGSPVAIFGRTDELDDRCTQMSPSYMRCMFYMRKPGTQAYPEKDVIFVPSTTRIGDVLALLKGGRFPFVLRRLRDGRYHLVGPALNGPFVGSLQSAAIVTPNGTGQEDWYERLFFRYGKIYWPDEHTETFVIV